MRSRNAKTLAHERSTAVVGPSREGTVAVLGKPGTRRDAGGNEFYSAAWLRPDTLRAV